jgi:hypothetical protein
MRFSKRQPVVEAVQYDGNSATARTFIGDTFDRDWTYNEGEKPILTRTVSGNVVRWNSGDWIVRTAEGEIQRWKDAQFLANFEPASEMPAKLVNPTPSQPTEPSYDEQFEAGKASKLNGEPSPVSTATPAFREGYESSNYESPNTAPAPLV